MMAGRPLEIGTKSSQKRDAKNKLFFISFNSIELVGDKCTLIFFYSVKSKLSSDRWHLDMVQMSTAKKGIKTNNRKRNIASVLVSLHLDDQQD